MTPGIDFYELGVATGFIIGALLMGAIMGAFPLTLGLIKGRKKLAIGGFVACLVGSLILGLLLSVPLAILFVILIFVTERKSRE